MDYFKILYEGEKSFGRFIFIEELDNNLFKLTFARFLNKITKKKQKHIGFTVTDTKENIYKILIQSIVDFTIPKSKCRIFLR